MANPNKPFGFQPLEDQGKQHRVRQYAKGTSAALYAGDAVKLGSDGAVVVAAAGDRIIGVAAEYQPTSVASIAVYDDPNQTFYAQCDADFQLADVGQNANITATAGDANLKLSKHDIDMASFATTVTHQFKIIGLVPRGENAVGSYAMIKVIPNNHEFKSGVSGV